MRPILTTAQVGRFARGAGAYPTTRTVSDWAKRGHVVASIAPPRGRRHPAQWSVEDAVCVRSVGLLRAANCDIAAAGAWVDVVVRPLLVGNVPVCVVVDVIDGNPYSVEGAEYARANSGASDTQVELELRMWLAAASAQAARQPTLF